MSPTATVIQFPSPPPTHYPVHRPQDVLPDPSEICSVVALDTETTGLHVDDGATVCAVSISYRLASDPSVIVDWAFPFDQGRAAEKGFHPLRYKDGRLKSDVDLELWDADVNLDKDSWDWLCDWLQRVGQACGLVTQNGKFDYHQMLNGTRYWFGVELEMYQAWDTQLTNKVLDPLEATGLKPTAERIWGPAEVAESVELKEALAAGKKLYGLKAEDGPRYDLIPWRINGPYAAKDTNLTLRSCELQVLRLEEGEGSWRVAHQQIDLGRVLYRIEKRRFGPYDVAASRAIADRLDARLAELAPIFPFQPPTAAKATEYFYEQLGLRPWKPGEDPRGFEIKQGRARAVHVPGRKEDRAQVEERFPAATSIVFKQGSLTADIAARMGAAGAPFATEYAEYLKAKISNQMFYRGYADLADPATGKLMTNFRQAMVKSGRMSVERWQAQALPKGVKLVLDGELLPEPKSLFGVDPGKVRINLDLSQAELRISSQLAGCETMAKPLREGVDLHGQTCTRIFGKAPTDPDWKQFRDVAKRLNFGGIFMIGAAAFRENLWTQGAVEWSLAECKVATDGFKRTYPEIPVAYEHWQRVAAEKGYVELFDGQRSWFGPRDYPNTAWNRVVQGSLAAWVADWLIIVEQMTEQWDALVMTVHDSAVLDLPEDVADDVTARIVQISEEYWLERFGFPGRLDSEVWH